MGVVLSAKQKEEMGLLGAQPKPPPDPCLRCEQEKAELEAQLAEALKVASAYEEWKRDPSSARPYTEIRAELVEEGILSADEPEPEPEPEPNEED